MRLAGVNLNLLIVLDALLSERSVTAAARRVGLSQSATSHSLARLREHFEDPLLLRSPEGTVLTERALELAEPVREIIEASERLLEPRGSFDPATASMELRIAMDEATQLTFLPVLFERLRQDAPGISLVAPRHRRDELARDLRSGVCDLTISSQSPATAKIHSALLAICDYTSIVRKNHPRVGRRLTLERFVELEHIAMARADLVDPELDRALLKQRVRRNVALTVASPGPVPALVASTDLVATLPRVMLTLNPPARPVECHVPPVELDPISIFLFWHERTDGSPAHAWMRSLIGEVFREIMDRV